MSTPLQDHAPDLDRKNKTVENELSNAQCSFEIVSNTVPEENYDIQYVAVLSSN